MRKDNRQSALWMTGSMTAFATGDTLIKLIGETLPVAQIIVLRGVPALILVWILARSLGAIRLSLPREDWRLLVWRSFADVCTTYFFLTALVNMPIANATAVLQVSPLVLTLAGAVFLGEQVGWRRWMAVLVGFCGMLMIVQPGGDSFTIYSLYALAAVGFVTLRDIVTRKLSPAVPSMLVSMINTFNILAFGVVWSLWTPWVPVPPDQWILIFGAACLVLLAYICAIMTVRVGELSAVAPFRYTGLLVALILGWLVFGEWPDALALAGATIVVIAGLYTLWREARIKAQPG